MGKIFENEDFINSNVNHIKLTINLLKERNEFFSIAVNREGVSFDPPLPEEIMSSFGPFTIFALHNYTFDSVNMIDDKIQFEAGFGSENVGSILTLPLCAILQIIVDDMIILSNPTASFPANFVSSNTVSKNAFKLNPNNKKFF